MRPGKFLLGLTFIILGTVMFLANMGYSSWAFFSRLVEFWPVLLILLGIALIWGGDIPRWVALIIAVILFGGIILLAVNYTSPYGYGPFAFQGFIVS